jgi:broad specificity phosphatase PhoE
MMNRIVLIRHGQSEHQVNKMSGGWTDTPLTEFGRRQAGAIAARLKRDIAEKSCDLYSSDLKRAAQTAEVVGRELGQSPRFIAGLRECNYGAATGKSSQWAEENASQDLARGLFDCHLWPGAESGREFYNRVAACMDRLCDEHDEDRLAIVVTHGGTLSNIVVWWLGIPLDDLPERTCFTASSGSISVLTANRPNRVGIETLNDVCHLAGGLRSDNMGIFGGG